MRWQMSTRPTALARMRKGSRSARVAVEDEAEEEDAGSSGGPGDQRYTGQADGAGAPWPECRHNAPAAEQEEKRHRRHDARRRLRLLENHLAHRERVVGGERDEGERARQVQSGRLEVGDQGARQEVEAERRATVHGEKVPAMGVDLGPHLVLQRVAADGSAVLRPS